MNERVYSGPVTITSNTRFCYSGLRMPLQRFKRTSTGQSPLSREGSSTRGVANVQRDVNESSRGTTQGSRGFDGAVFLVQRDVNELSRGIT